MTRRAAVLSALLLAAEPAAAQQTADEQARRLLEDGRAYLRDGQHKQALDNFQTIATGFAGTEYVDDALLEIGRYRLEVDRDLEQARAAFELVTKRHPQSDGAAGAYYQLGRLVLDRATTPAQIDDAVAQFVRVERLYPRSEWVPRALLSASEAHRRAGRLPEAADLARRVALEHPTSDATPAAQYHLGEVLALLGEHRAAMEEFQQVRNRHPKSPEAERALQRITALFRLFGGPPPAFTTDAAFAAGAGDVLKDVRALLATADGALWIGSNKTKSAVRYGADGKMGVSHPGPDLRSLALGPDGTVILTTQRAVRFGPKDVRTYALPPEKEGAEPRPLDRLEAAVVTRGGSVLVADGDRKRVYRFDAQGAHLGAFPDAKERRVTRMLLDGEGAVILLDREARTVQSLAETGEVLRTVGPRGPGFELKKPVDVAVDPFRNLYVAEEEGGVLVFSPAGTLLATIGAGELRRPRAVAVDAAGAVLVYDDRLERVVRFR